MKKKAISLGIILIIMVAGGMVVVEAGNNKSGLRPGIDFNGPHYNLNLIGKKKAMPGEYDNPDRHTMFVPLDTTGMNFTINIPNILDPVGTKQENVTHLDGIKILMSRGSEFAMIDGDATDGLGGFQLGPDKYFVYIAVKAKSPKYADAFTDITGWVEAFDENGSLWYYIPIGSVSVQKKSGWVDATDIFFVSDDEDPFGFNEISGIQQDSDGIWVFDYLDGLDTWFEDSGETAPYDFSSLAYFWQFVNTGNKLIQVRFYPM